jgi:hypothetical protein
MGARWEELFSGELSTRLLFNALGPTEHFVTALASALPAELPFLPRFPTFTDPDTGEVTRSSLPLTLASMGLDSEELLHHRVAAGRMVAERLSAPARREAELEFLSLAAGGEGFRCPQLMNLMAFGIFPREAQATLADSRYRMTRDEDVGPRSFLGAAVELRHPSFPEIARQLYDLGWDVDAPDADGNGGTPLCLAVQSGNALAMSALLNLGADPSRAITGKDGRARPSPLEMVRQDLASARDPERKELMRQFLSHMQAWLARRAAEGALVAEAQVEKVLNAP